MMIVLTVPDWEDSGEKHILGAHNLFDPLDYITARTYSVYPQSLSEEKHAILMHW